MHSDTREAKKQMAHVDFYFKAENMPEAGKSF